MIIGLGHRRRVGKDTFATFLLDALHRLPSTKSVKIVGFADLVKDVCYRLYKQHGLMPGSFYETEEGVALRDVVLKGINMSPRTIWIKFGTDAVRDNVYYDTWLDATLHDCPRGKGEHSIIKDTRFPNEGDAILATGGIVCKVTRSSAQRSNDVADTALESYTKWSGIIQNHKGLPELVEKAKKLAKYIERKENE